MTVGKLVSPSLKLIVESSTSTYDLTPWVMSFQDTEWVRVRLNSFTYIGNMDANGAYYTLRIKTNLLSDKQIGGDLCTLHVSGFYGQPTNSVIVHSADMPYAYVDVRKRDLTSYGFEIFPELSRVSGTGTATDALFNAVLSFEPLN